MATPLFIPATYKDGPNSAQILIPYVDVLPLNPRTPVVVLDVVTGSLQPGMYVYQNQAWHPCMPIEAAAQIIVDGDDCEVDINVMSETVLAPNSIVYRNNQLTTGHILEPSTTVVWAVRYPKSGGGGAVTSVNGMVGDVVLTASNITGFAEVAISGQYSDLIGAPPAYSLPIATSSVLGGVLVPASGNIIIDGSGNISLNPTLVTKINSALTTVTTQGGGTSMVYNVTAPTLTLKTLAAGTNVTITDNGSGLLTIASTGGGAGTITLSGDATGASDPTGALPLTLNNVNANPGTFKSVTVNAKGLVTAGTNPTTLAGFGITDALPLTGGSMTGNIVMTAGTTIKGVPDPVNPTDVANREYVDAQLAAAANGVSWRASVDAATIANITLSGTQTIDGVTLSVGKRVLVKDQTVTTDNGIYDVSAGAWTRSADSDTGAEIWKAAALVIGGTVNGLTQWANTNVVQPTIGTDPITWGQLKAAGNVYTAGAGLTLTGLQFSITPTGIAAGTYAKVTVNALGMVTAGSALASTDVTTALGFTPYNGTTNPNGFIGSLQATGDATGTATVTGSSASLPLVLASTGVAVGTYSKVTVDAKGRVTAGAQLDSATIVAALGFTPVNKAGDTMLGALNWNGVVNLASAATVNIGAAASNFIRITGTTAITSFDAGPIGAERILTFVAACTLTQGTGIGLPGTGNITTQPGDVVTFVCTAASTWKCTSYLRQDGTPIAGGGGTPFSTTQVFNGDLTQVAAKFKNVVEFANIISTAPSGTVPVDLSGDAVNVYTASPSANWTFNLRHSSSTTLNNAMAIGDSATFVMITTQGATAFIPTTWQIDGTTVVPQWQGGVAPSSGNASSRDVYTVTVIKIANASFITMAAQTQFK